MMTNSIGGFCPSPSLPLGSPRLDKSRTMEVQFMYRCWVIWISHLIIIGFIFFWVAMLTGLVIVQYNDPSDDSRVTRKFNND